jgi:hypothetical protein
MAKFRGGNLDLNTNQKIRFGNSQEFLLEYDGTNLKVTTITSNPLIVDGNYEVTGSIIVDQLIPRDSTAVTILGNIIADVVETSTIQSSGDMTITAGDSGFEGLYIPRHTALGNISNIAAIYGAGFAKVDLGGTYSIVELIAERNSHPDLFGLYIWVENSLNDSGATTVGATILADATLQTDADDILGATIGAQFSSALALSTGIKGLQVNIGLTGDNSSIPTATGAEVYVATGYSMVNCVIDTLVALDVGTLKYGSGQVSINDTYGIRLSAPAYNPTGTTTNLYGLYIADFSTKGWTNDWNIYSAGANSENYIEGNLRVDGDLKVNGSLISDSTSLVTTLDIVTTGDIYCNDLHTAGSTLYVGTGEIKSTSGDVQLNYGSEKALTTITEGVKIFDPSNPSITGLEIKYDGDDLIIQNTDPSGDIYIEGTDSGSVVRRMISIDPRDEVQLYCNDDDLYHVSVDTQKYGVRFGSYNQGQSEISHGAGDTILESYTFDSEVMICNRDGSNTRKTLATFGPNSCSIGSNSYYNTSFYDDEGYWDADTGSWTGSYWQSDGSGELILLAEGTWYLGYRPNKIRLLVPDGFFNVEIYDEDDNLIGNDADYTSYGVIKLTFVEPYNIQAIVIQESLSTQFVLNEIGLYEEDIYGITIDSTISGGVSVSNGTLNVGVDDNTPGIVHLYAGDGEGAVGGEIRIYNPSDYDEPIEYYSINSPVDNAHLYIGPNTDPDSLMYNGDTNTWNFTGAVSGQAPVNSDDLVTKEYSDSLVLSTYSNKPLGYLGEASVGRDAYNLTVYPEYYNQDSVSDIAATPGIITFLPLDNSLFIAIWSDGSQEESYFRTFNRHMQQMIGDTMFIGQETLSIDATQLDNGTIVIAYVVNGLGYHTEFVIYDTQANELVSPVTVSSSVCSDVSVTKLAGNRFLVVYDDSDGLYFQIYNSDGSVFVSETTIDSVEEASSVSRAETLNNGGAVIVWVPGTSAIPEFTILDAFGNVVKVNTQIGSVALTAKNQFDLTVTPSGNFTVAYIQINTSNAYRACYDQWGNTVRSPVNFGSVIGGSVWTEIGITYTPDGDCFIGVYNDDDGDLYTAVFSQGGEQTVQALTASTTPAWTGFQYPVVFTLRGGAVCVGYTQSGPGDTTIIRYKAKTVWIDGYLKLDNGTTVNEFSTDERLVDDLGESYDYMVPVQTAVRTYSDNHQTSNKHIATDYLNSFVKMKDFWGIDVDETSYVEQDSISFGSSIVPNRISATPFSDNKMFVTFNNTNSLYFSTFTSDGTALLENILVSSTSYANEYTGQCCTLSNGNVVVIWADTGDNAGRFTIYNPETGDDVFGATGEFISLNGAATTFNGEMSIAPLKNGGFVITWYDGIQGRRYMNHFRFDGTRVFTEDRDFAASGNGSITSKEFVDGKIVYAFSFSNSMWLHLRDDYIDDIIIQNNVIGTTALHAELAILPSSKVALLYDEASTSDLKLFIADGYMAEIAHVDIETTQQHTLSERKMVVLPNGDLFIVYVMTSGGNQGKIYYQIYDSDGNQKVAETQIIGPTTADLVTAELFPDGSIFIAYSTTGNEQHFIKMNANAKFKRTVGGQTPVNDSDFATKEYVDTVASAGGQTAIVADSTAITVNFSEQQADTNFYPICSIENTTDVSPSFYSLIITNKTVGGFTVEFDNPVDSGNYKLNWKISR